MLCLCKEKVMKRVLGFIALVLITGLLFAAGAAETKPAAAGLNIAIITTPSGVDDGSFNQDILHRGDTECAVRSLQCYLPSKNSNYSSLRYKLLELYFRS